MRSMSLGGVLVVAALATFVSCKDDGEQDDKGDIIARETIGPEGGTLTGAGVTLVVPAGAVTTDTEFELRESSQNLSALDYEQSGGAMALYPEGLVLRLPAELRIDGGPDSPAVLFRQDGLTVAAQGTTAWINELSTFSVAMAGTQRATLTEPMIGASPDQAGQAIRDLVHLKLGVSETPRLNLALTVYDPQDYYDKPLNGSNEGDCGFKLENVLGGSLLAGCSDSPLSSTVRVTSDEVEFDIVPFLAGKMEVPVVVGLVAGSDELAHQLGFFSFDTSACYGETCSGRGMCQPTGDSGAECLCDPGYAPNGLECECVPQCEGRSCGGDGCGGLCPPGCGDAEICEDGTCVSDTGPSDTGPSDTGMMDTGSMDTGSMDTGSMDTSGGSTSTGSTGSTT